MFIENPPEISGLKWMGALEAVELMTGASGGEAKAKVALIRRAGADMVPSRCVRMRIKAFTGGAVQLFDSKRISFEFWKLFENERSQTDDNWSLGDFELFQTLDQGQSRYIAVYGTEFALPPAQQTTVIVEAPTSFLSAPMTPVKSLGGRPRKGWWDDLWIEMIRRLQTGKLKPTSAAQLEGIMNDWLTGQGFSPGDSTLKPSSIKLFKYLKENGG